MTAIEKLKDRIPTTPAFLIDENTILSALDSLAALREKCGCKVLYSIKSLPLTEIMRLAKPYVDGFSVSSIFEARLANEVLTGQGGIHLCTPGIRPDDTNELATLCTHISCNSLRQFRQFESIGDKAVSIGFRVNPHLSFTEDVRYDPCRPFSKLGVDMDCLLDAGLLNCSKGLHFHTIFGAANYTPLLQTLNKIETFLGSHLSRLDWLNLGGGYLYDQIEDNADFCETIFRLKTDYNLDVFIEPGNALVGKSGFLVATVLDCFQSDGKTIAVLDTSINHLPEVFEYQRQPNVLEHHPNGGYSAVLAGSTCLAGDLFGEYRFNRPLEIGDRLTFNQVGAYSLVKANRFNGYNLPDIYAVRNEQIKLLKRHTYREYRQLWINDVD